MGLPWFAFNIKDFIANTKRLNTEAKGAYLLLILDYYEQECGPPDDDDTLATICELSEDAWKRHRKVLAPMFEIKDGYWYHARIEKEILEGAEKHAKMVARSKAGNAAKQLKRASEAPTRKPQGPKKQKSPHKDASGVPEGSLKETLEAPQTQTHITLSSERVIARAQDSENGSVGQEENPLGSMLDPNWVPDDDGIAFARGQGMDSDETIKAELLAFHDRHSANGTFSRNWPGSWRTWCKRFAERDADKPKAAPPRVEVNNTPTDSNWDWACAQWAKGASFWSHKTLGPAPDMPGCRCPKKFLEKYHIDPATGRVATPSETET
jgi:uncharacterized protein YdaU (DUF1376 family)